MRNNHLKGYALPICDVPALYKAYGLLVLLPIL